MRQLNRATFILAAAVMVWLLQPVQSGALGAEPDRITVEELKNLLDAKADIIVVDVRNTDSYDLAHIPGALPLPSGETRDRHKELPKDKLIVLY